MLSKMWTLRVFSENKPILLWGFFIITFRSLLECTFFHVLQNVTPPPSCAFLMNYILAAGGQHQPRLQWSQIYNWKGWREHRQRVGRTVAGPGQASETSWTFVHYQQFLLVFFYLTL